MTLLRFLSLHCFSFFLIVAFSAYAEHLRPVPEVILLYGASCSGKSTLANKLQQSLKQSWSILDWDNYAEEFGDDLASEVTVHGGKNPSPSPRAHPITHKFFRTLLQ